MLKSVKVMDVMVTQWVKFSPEIEIYQAIETLLEHRISSAPVINDSGSLVGVFSESDCLRRILDSSYHEEQGGDNRVEHYMSPKVDVLSPEVGIVEAAQIFIANNRRRLPVVEEGKVVGLVSRRDILSAVLAF